MFQRIRLASLGLVVLSVALCSGCLEMKQTITVHPDGAGKIVIEQKMGEQFSSMMLMAAQGDEAQQKEVALETIYKEMAKWDGIVAWANVEGGVEDGRVSATATGYFANVADLSKIGEDSGGAFAFKTNADGGCTLSFTSEGGPMGGEGGPLDDETPPEQMEMQLNMMRGMLKDLRIESVVRMPGTVTAIEGCEEHEGREAKTVITADEFIKLIETTVELTKKYKKEVEAGSITKEEGNEKIVAELKKMAGPMLGWSVTCGAAEDAAEQEAFKAELEAAKAAYEGSDLQEKVKGALEDE